MSISPPYLNWTVINQIIVEFSWSSHLTTSFPGSALIRMSVRWYTPFLSLRSLIRLLPSLLLHKKNWMLIFHFSSAVAALFTMPSDRCGRLHRATCPPLTFSSARDARNGSAQLPGVVFSTAGDHTRLPYCRELRSRPPDGITPPAPIHNIEFRAGVELRVDVPPFL
jgi:hypothetical protein